MLSGRKRDWREIYYGDIDILYSSFDFTCRNMGDCGKALLLFASGVGQNLRQAEGGEACGNGKAHGKN